MLFCFSVSIIDFEQVNAGCVKVECLFNVIDKNAKLIC